MTDEVFVLEIALREMSLQLNDLVAACTDEAGKPKAPDRRMLMGARGMLPPYCSMAFRKESK